MTAQVEYISASCNCTYNNLELTDGFLVYGANHALATYNLEEQKVTNTFVSHKGRINCVRFVKSANQNSRNWLLTCATDGATILWKNDNLNFKPMVKQIYEAPMTVSDGVEKNPEQFIIGTITSYSQIIIYESSLENMTILQEINLEKSLALEIVFHSYCDKIILALGMDSGSVLLYGETEDKKSFNQVSCLSKHEDWVRSISFVNLENGEILLASGGEDSYIAIWRLIKNPLNKSEFEFQVHHFQDLTIVFDSMIIGHEGWINSLAWNSKGELLSCSSDQSIIIWTNNNSEIWTEKARFGVMGGEIPGGFGAKFSQDKVVTWGFQGAIQIWSLEEGTEWSRQASVTGHFGPVSDLDYHNSGHFLVTTSEDQTTRIHATWGLSRWHEISRPQIHGHNLFTVKFIENYIVSGAEEKILRSFQPTEVFIQNMEDISEINLDIKSVGSVSASLPALGLSNQSEDSSDTTCIIQELSIDTRLDEDFLRSKTLWPEVSKLYGHVYEISILATSPKYPLIASASHATKPQYAAIILWSSTTWKNLGEFQFHKLNVIDMEFSPDGKYLLSSSRDRTWALWKVSVDSESTSCYSIQVIQSANFHTRALWVGTWSPNSLYFVTGGRDKKLAVWKSTGNEDKPFEIDTNQVFDASVSAAAINEGVIAIGLESGVISIHQYKSGEALQKLLCLDNSNAHHDIVKRLKFNPVEKYQLASVGADHIVKIYQLCY